MIFDQDKRLIKVLSTLLIFGQVFFGGGVAFAQTTTDEVVPQEPTSTIEEIAELTPATTTDISTDETTPPVVVDTTVATDTEPIILPDDTTDLQGASSTPQLQETFIEQDTVDPSNTSEDDEVVLATTTDDVLPPEDVVTDEGTTTDEYATTTDDEAVVDNSTSVDENVPSTDEEVIPDEVIPPPPVQDPAPEVTPPPPALPIIKRAELKPNPKYMFSINSGKHVSTTRRVNKKVRDAKTGKTVDTEVTEVASAPPNVTVDNTNGVMNISGSCSDAYYVILVYKNESDYANNKNLAIVNRAFPCVGGAYSYDLRELPTTLEDGTYYLLVAGMGENTPWQPITSLTEINLQRNN